MWVRLNKLLFVLFLLNQSPVLAQKGTALKMDASQPLFGSLLFSVNPNYEAKFSSEITVGFSGNWTNKFLGVAKNSGVIAKYGVYVINLNLLKSNPNFNTSFYVKPEFTVFSHTATFLLSDRYFSTENQQMQIADVNYKVKANGACLFLNAGQSFHIKKWVFDYYAGIGVMYKNLQVNKDVEDATDLKVTFQIFAPNYIYGYDKIKETIQAGCRIGYIISP